MVWGAIRKTFALFPFITKYSSNNDVTCKVRKRLLCNWEGASELFLMMTGQILGIETIIVLESIYIAVIVIDFAILDNMADFFSSIAENE